MIQKNHSILLICGFIFGYFRTPPYSMYNFLKDGDASFRSKVMTFNLLFSLPYTKRNRQKYRFPSQQCSSQSWEIWCTRKSVLEHVTPRRNSLINCCYGKKVFLGGTEATFHSALMRFTKLLFLNPILIFSKKICYPVSCITTIISGIYPQKH